MATARKSAKKKVNKSAGSGPHCWPGFKPVAGKKPGTKGSCEPKARQTPAEKKADSRAAAGSKLRKAGGNKAKANRG